MPSSCVGSRRIDLPSAMMLEHLPQRLAMTDQAVVEVDDLVRQFGRFTASVDHVSFDRSAHGEIFGLLRAERRQAANRRPSACSAACSCQLMAR